MSRIASLEMSPHMRRIALLVLGLCSMAWASGCCCWCHKHYSRCDDGDGYYAEDGRRSKKQMRRAEKLERKRGGRRDRSDDDDGVCGNCCSACCDGGCSMGCPSTFDGGMMGGCASGNCGPGGCASGNCGAQQTFGGQQTYNGTPFDPNAGWTIQSTTSHPVGNEPVLAPPSSPGAPTTPTPGRAQGWVPSSAPAPGPVPPVSYNR